MTQFSLLPSVVPQTPLTRPLWMWIVGTFLSFVLGMLTMVALTAVIIPLAGQVGFLLVLLGSAVCIGLCQQPFVLIAWVYTERLRWLVVTIIACGMALLSIYVCFSISIGRTALIANRLIYLAGPLSGGIFSGIQWLYLRQLVSRAGWWILATIISASVIWFPLVFVINSLVIVGD